MGQQSALLGIDLGTSFSSVAYLDSGGYARSILNKEGAPATPSVVYLSENGPVVGSQAVKAYVHDPVRVVFHPKRVLGDGLTTWEIDDVEYTPTDITAIILRRLLSDARRTVGAVDRAVLTVPVHFNSHQRQLVMSAAEQAGLEVMGILNEPVAAALCFILGEAGAAFAELAVDQRVLVYDLGGGTFDLSVVDYRPGNIQVLAANGDLKLGGIDWNQRIMDIVIAQVMQDKGIDLRAPDRRKTFARLAMEVESAKRKMSEVEAPLRIPIHCREGEFAARIDRGKFERSTADLLDRSRELLEQIVAAVPRRLGQGRSGGWSDIDSMIIVGGASRMPMVRRMVGNLVKSHSGLIKEIDPEMSISHGAALYAGLLQLQEQTDAPDPEAKGNVTVQNVTGLSLGLIVMNGEGQRVLHPLIKQNSPLPAAARVLVATTHPSQSRVSLKFAEVGTDGEVCRCVLDNLPAGLPAGSTVDVDLNYDTSGMLHVIGRHRASGRLASISVNRKTGGGRIALLPRQRPDRPSAGPAAVGRSVRGAQPLDTTSSRNPL